MAADIDALIAPLADQFEQAGISIDKGPPLAAVIDAYRERASTFQEMAESASYLFEDVAEFDPKPQKNTCGR